MPEFPARAVGAQRGRIDQRADDVDAGLDAEHAEAGKERRDQQRRLRGQSGITDRADHRHRDHEHDRDGEETVPLEPPQSSSAPTVPPTCSIAPASAPVAGGSFAAVISVGVHLSRKK